MEIGKLYQLKELYWLLYPSMKVARTASFDLGDAGIACSSGPEWSAFWSKRLKCNVTFISPNSFFMLLEQRDRYCKILSAEGTVNWIILNEWCKSFIVEVKRND